MLRGAKTLSAVGSYNPQNLTLGVKQDNGAQPVSADTCMRAQHPRHPAVTTSLLPSLLPLH